MLSALIIGVTVMLTFGFAEENYYNKYIKGNKCPSAYYAKNISIINNKSDDFDKSLTVIEAFKKSINNTYLKSEIKGKTKGIKKNKTIEKKVITKKRNKLRKDRRNKPVRKKNKIYLNRNVTDKRKVIHKTKSNKIKMNPNGLKNLKVNEKLKVFLIEGNHSRNVPSSKINVNRRDSSDFPQKLISFVSWHPNEKDYGTIGMELNELLSKPLKKTHSLNHMDHYFKLMGVKEGQQKQFRSSEASPSVKEKKHKKGKHRLEQDGKQSKSSNHDQENSEIAMYLFKNPKIISELEQVTNYNKTSDIKFSYNLTENQVTTQSNFINYTKTEENIEQNNTVWAENDWNSDLNSFLNVMLHFDKMNSTKETSSSKSEEITSTELGDEYSVMANEKDTDYQTNDDNINNRNNPLNNKTNIDEGIEHENNYNGISITEQTVKQNNLEAFLKNEPTDQSSNLIKTNNYFPITESDYVSSTPEMEKNEEVTLTYEGISDSLYTGEKINAHKLLKEDQLTNTMSGKGNSTVIEKNTREITSIDEQQFQNLGNNIEKPSPQLMNNQESFENRHLPIQYDYETHLNSKGRAFFHGHNRNCPCCQKLEEPLKANATIFCPFCHNKLEILIATIKGSSLFRNARQQFQHDINRNRNKTLSQIRINKKTSNGVR